ncbi:MAG TPA: ABC transporter ATP-binding protein [Geminicoccaceae bacterium]|nr:ABC transporter ATP-binding protein [Geminicoccus sp.]HMU49149.1 ABC transporter ATP-binding protein [Geminicoccaceae bacterium]
MLGVIRIFLSTGGIYRWIVLGAVLLGALAEGLGLASLLPLISVALDQSAVGDSRISAMVVDLLATIGVMPDLESLLVFIVVMIFIKAALTLTTQRTINYAVSDVAADFRRRLMETILQVRWSYFTRQPIGRLANAISLDSARSADAFQLAANFIAISMQSLAYVLIALYASWQLAAVGLVAGLITIAVLAPLIQRTRTHSKRQRKRTEDLVRLTTDTLGSIKPLLAMSRHWHFASFYNEKVRDLRRALRRQALSKYLMKSIREPLLAVLIAGGFYVAYKKLDVGIPELVVMGIVFRRLVSAMGEAQEQLQAAVAVEASFWSVHNLITEAESQREVNRGGREPTLDRGIALDDVSFGYDEHRLVLERFNMVAPAGKLTVLGGVSGGGKTTITDLILGLHEPLSGRVLVDGTPLTEIDLKRWRSMVGYVPQELGLFHESILANVTLGDPTISEEAVKRALARAGVLEFVAALPEGLHTDVGERGSRLSGGQRQRIALARALVLEPKLLILDEVSSALDPDTEAEICANVRELAGSCTIIAITHRPIWIEMADQVYRVGLDEAA